MNDNILALLPKVYFPNRIVIGNKAHLSLKTIVGKKPLLIISKSFLAKNTDLIKKSTEKNWVRYVHSGEPTSNTLDELQTLSKLKNIDFIVAIGGGSVIDLAKIVKKDLGIEMAAIPTTIGSGSEVSQFSLINTGGAKKIFHFEKLLPETILLDQNFLLTINKDDIFSQSIDGLAHGFEALVSKLANPLSDILSLSGISLIYNNLLKIKAIEKNPDVILELKIGSTLTGLAQSSVGTGLAHSLGHYFGVKNGIGHAQAITMFLPAVLKFNKHHTDKYQKLNNIKDMSVNNFTSKIDNLYKLFNYKPQKIHLVDDLDRTIQAIRSDVALLTNPYRPTEEELKRLLRSYFE